VVAVFRNPPIPWHRLRDFQTVSLRLLIERLLTAWRVPGADRAIFIPSDRLLRPTPRLVTKRPYHFYHSPHNPGVELIVDMLEQAAPRRAAPLGLQLRRTSMSGLPLSVLRSTDALDHASPASVVCFLVYLHAETFSPGDRATSLTRELQAALHDGVPPPHRGPEMGRDGPRSPAIARD